MEKENDFLTGIAQDGEELDTDKQFSEVVDENSNEEEKETPTESSSEDNQDGDEPSQEGGEESKGDSDENTLDEKPEPFHKHPRWQQMRTENEDLKATLDELKTRVDEGEKAQSPIEMPDWAAKAFGTDEVGKQIYQGFINQGKSDREQIREEILAEQEELATQQQQEQKKWDNWADEGIETLKENGKDFDRNELIKVAIEYQPTDDEGNISLDKAYAILSMQKAQKEADGKGKNNARKKLASSTVSNNQGEPTPSNQIDPKELRSKSFSALVQDSDLTI